MKLIVANWKLYLTPDQTYRLSADLVSALTHISPHTLRVVLTPSVVSLETVHRLTANHAALHTGAQNCSISIEGAFTGETSARSLQSIGVDYVLIGHSERREHFGETDAIVAQKITAALSCGLCPIVCCGENQAVRRRNQQETYVTGQLKAALGHLAADQVARVVIAYEPIWAIGTSAQAPPEAIQAMHICIRRAMRRWYDFSGISEPMLIYGGNCNTKNAASILSCPDVDGVLVGRASLCADTFTSIVQCAL